MSDRTLVQEFSPFTAAANGATGVWSLVNGISDWRGLLPATYTNQNYWVCESKLDLAGYAMDDLTFFFRNSFEQDGGFRSIAWTADGKEKISPYATTVLENVIVSSVPLTDQQLVASLVVAPGFTPFGGSIPNFFGNFNRTHIIHGHLTGYDVNLDQIADATMPGVSWITPEQDFYYSSLEPTAADCLYCYRVLGLPTGAPLDGAGATSCGLGPKRVIMSGMSAEEPQLEYMMRLKRSYELANQV